MTRFFLTLICMVAFLSAVSAVERAEETPDERARRVRVALAVSSSTPAVADVVPAVLPEVGCGRCVDDLEDARRLSRSSGKPIVLFVSVNGCEGRAKSLPAEVIAVRSATYTQDGKPASVPRIVVLMPSYEKWEPTWLMPVELAGNASAELINAELEKTRKPAPVAAQPVHAPPVHVIPQAQPVQLIPQQFMIPQFTLPGAAPCPNCRTK